MSDQKAAELPATSAGSEDRLESQVYRNLFDKIRFGTFGMGQRLPSEVQLCEEFGVSRPVIRAALAKLRDSGLIVSRQGSGSFVNSPVQTTGSGYTPLTSITDIATYFRFRRVIEAASVEQAAERADRSSVARLNALVDEMRSRLSRNEETVQHDISFHTTIAELSDNRFLIETIEMLQPHWIFVGNFVRSLGMTGQRKGKRMTGEHMAIVEAIGAGDAKAARKAMQVHIDGSERRVFKGEP